MPTLYDLPTIQPILTVVGGDLLPIYDISDFDGQVKKLRLNQINGLSATDVRTETATTGTISTRLTVCTNAGAVTNLTLPLASGALREVVVMKPTAAGDVTIQRAGTDDIVRGTSLTATSVVMAFGTSAHLLSDGTKWYHVSNDVA